MTKNALVKVLDAHPVEWLHINEGVLFARRVSRHLSTKYPPFLLIYNKEPLLPINVKFSLAGREVNETEFFEEETLDAILASATRIRGEIDESETSNIRKAQDKQKNDFDRRRLSSSKIKVGDYILLCNNKRKGRKGGKLSFAGLGLYIVSKITLKGVATF